MSKRPKLSGAQGRKKRKEEEEKREKDRDALLKFLNPTPGPSTTSTAAASTSAAQPTSDAASAAQPSHDAAASSGPPAAPIDPADWPSALTEKVGCSPETCENHLIMCEEMNVEAELKQKRLRTTKRHFGYESPDEPIQDALKKMETTFFNVVVDTAISSLDERFQNLGEVNDKFGVLLNFHNLQKEELLQQCQTLSTTLTHDSQTDINGTELAMEMQNFPPLPSKNMTNMELLTFLHEKKLAEIYPNMWVALRIFATLPVTVAAAERSFSKLKLIKTYLRSTMMQERLSGLSIISINHVVSNQLSYDDVVDYFAARKTRRVRL
ncbi:cytochrome c oxidase subunit 5b [Sarotherodon galilaeus]